MDISDLRLHALQQAAVDSRFNTSGGQTMQAAPEVITTRAKAYLQFLVHGMPSPAAKAKKKR